MQESFSQFNTGVVTVLRQYHVTIFSVIIAILLCIAVVRLTNIVQLSTTEGVDGYAPVAKANGNFDQKTIDRVDSLRTTDEGTSALQFPARKSPFTE